MFHCKMPIAVAELDEARDNLAFCSPAKLSDVAIAVTHTLLLEALLSRVCVITTALDDGAALLDRHPCSTQGF